MDICEADTSLKPPINYFFAREKDRLTNEVNRAWVSIEGFKVSRSIWPELNATVSKLMLGLNSRSLRLCTCVLTGHSSISAMTSKGDRDKPDFCRLCGEIEELETIEYVLCNCPCLQSSRAKLLGSHIIGELRDISTKPLEDVLSFIKGLKWLTPQ